MPIDYQFEAANVKTSEAKLIEEEPAMQTNQLVPVETSPVPPVDAGQLVPVEADA
jgi:hypothetical protein